MGIMPKLLACRLGNGGEQKGPATLPLETSGQIVVNDHGLLVGQGFIFGSRFQQKLMMKTELETVLQSLQDKVGLWLIGMISQLPGKLVHLDEGYFQNWVK